nr:hypothetical protein [Saprospiraceae bacterium]
MEPYNKKLPENYIDREEFISWSTESEELTGLLSSLKTEYHNYKAEHENHGQWVDFLDSSGANGIMMHPAKYPDEIKNWHFVAEFLKDRVLSWGYKLYSSNKRFKADLSGTTHFRHYLKPPVKNVLSPPVDQLFGNVTIELTERNADIETLKIQIQHYSDRNYQPPRDIEDLYYSIFDKD